MARILVEQKWFEQVEPSTFSEMQFEDRVVLHAPSIYPEYYVTTFKCTLDSPNGKTIPDLAFISKDYEEWKIIEVEMGYHSFSQHVEPQVSRIINATYDRDVANYLYSKEGELDPELTLELVLDKPPEVIVIVNEYKPDWDRHLRKLGAAVVTFELFRSESNLEIFRVDGQYPSHFINSISQCSFHPIVHRLLEIEQPQALDLPRGGNVRLRYNNCITEWKRIDAEGKVWLSPLGRNPLRPEHTYEIYRQGDNQLVLRRNIE
jgi:hypothetical protein